MADSAAVRAPLLLKRMPARTIGTSVQVLSRGRPGYAIEPGNQQQQGDHERGDRQRRPPAHQGHQASAVVDGPRWSRAWLWTSRRADKLAIHTAGRHAGLPSDDALRLQWQQRHGGEGAYGSRGPRCGANSGAAAGAMTSTALPRPSVHATRAALSPQLDMTARWTAEAVPHGSWRWACASGDCRLSAVAALWCAAAKGPR